jgi:predicted porin
VTTKANGVKDYATGKTYSGIDSSNMNTQFWGLRGSEDLGNGLKAIFKLESNFNIDNGASQANLFEREANVGLSGGFGTVLLGRNYTAYDDLFGATAHTLNSNINVSSAVNATGNAQYANRINNSIRYSSPVMGGVSGSVSYGFGENKTASASATRNVGAQVRYAAGPVLVGLGYQEQTSQTANDDLEFTLVGASYDLGMAKLTGSYQTSEKGSTKDKEYQIGVVVPMGAVTVSAGMANSESKTGAAKLKGDGYALLASYALSKRTAAYVGYESTEVNTSSTKTEVTNMAVGIRHTF